MRFALFAGFFLACFAPSAFSAQLPAAKTDPLAKPPAGQAAGWPSRRSMLGHGGVVRRGGGKNSAPSDGAFAARGKSAPPDR